jgi:hypothetical protein
MERIKLDGDAEMFHRFLQASTFLQNFVAETVPSQEALGILRHHLAK